MIKCNVTVCGTIGRDASARTNKDGKPFLTFPLRVAIQGKDDQKETVEIGVSKDGGQEEASGYRNGSRVEITGTMYLKRRGEKLYFNLGKNIEERKDKNDKPYSMFSAFSAEKVNDGFEYQWVRFFHFGSQREEWLQPGVKIDARGEMTLSVHNGKPDLSCRVEELALYVPAADHPNQ